MRFRKGKEEEIRLGIAPLIDIVFLLLIFFMVTSHFDVSSGLRIHLPKVAQRIFDPEKDKTTVVIDKSGQTYFEGKELDLKALRKRLEQLVDKKDLVQLILQADKNVRHGRVVQIMDLAKRAGVQNIIIAAQWKTEKVF